MTDSYFSALGRATDAPPDISKTNYLDTEADMSKAVNDNITEISNSWDEHYNQMIEIYKHIHKQKSPAENLLQVMKHGKEFKDEFEAWQDEWEPIRDMNGKINERVVELKKIHGDDSAAYLKSLQTIVDDDPEIKKEVDNEAELAASRVESNKVGYKDIKDGYVKEGVEIIEGPNGLFMKDVELANNIKSLKAGVPGWFKVSDEAIKHHLESFGYTADGQPIHKSLNEATLPEEKFEIRLRNIAWYAHIHKDVAKGRFGKYKKDFLKAVLLEQDTWKKGVLEDHAAASLELITERNSKELYAKVEQDPNSYLTHVKTHAGHPEHINAKGNVNHALVLDRTNEKMVDGIKDGQFENPAKLVEALGNLEFRPFGHPEGYTVKFKDHWKKRYGKLVAAKNEYYKAERLAKESETKAVQDKQQVDIVQWAEGKPFEEVKARVAQYMSEWSLGPEELPTAFKDLQYEGLEEDNVILERVSKIRNRPLTMKDIKGLTPGTPQYEALVEQIKKPLSVGSVKKGAGSYGWRDDFIKAQIASNLKITVQDVQGNPKAVIMKEKAESLYNSVYYDTKASDVNISNAAAHNEAVAQVKDLLDLKKNPTVGEARISTNDIDSAKIANRAVASIQKNPNLINSSKPLEGEEPYIELAAKFLDDYQNNRGGTAPSFYKSIGAKLGNQLSVPQIIRGRLEALGRLKEGEVVFPEEGKPGERLLVNPTAAKTIRAFKLNEEDNWMIEQSKNPEAIANGGYLSVSDKDGNYTSIEEVTGKPMEAITMSDVINLVSDKYTGFGIFDIPSYALMEIVSTNGIPLDMVFDEDGQDYLYLAALRNKAQKAQSNAGIIADYRRLVNIKKEDLERFNELAGDLVKGKPWLDLNNLAPEVAKEWINALTQ